MLQLLLKQKLIKMHTLLQAVAQRASHGNRTLVGNAMVQVDSLLQQEVIEIHTLLQTSRQKHVRYIEQ